MLLPFNLGTKADSSFTEGREWGALAHVAISEFPNFANC